MTTVWFPSYKCYIRSKNCCWNFVFQSVIFLGVHQVILIIEEFYVNFLTI